MAVEAMESEILILGGGLAGAFAAIKAREAGAGKVTLVSKGKIGKDSEAAQAAGMYAMATPDDDWNELYRRAALTDDYGAGLFDPEWLDVDLEESYQRAIDMEKYGVEWEKTSDGKFERKLMRSGFGMAAMFHGPQLMEAMARKVIKSGVKVVGYSMATGLLTERGEPGARVVGAVGFNARTGELQVFRARATILAMGGCMFKARQVGSHVQTGEAFAMAYRAGARLGRFAESEVMYVCPSDCDTQGMNMFIGLGGRFVNASGEEFMKEYEPQLGEHASLGTVAGAMAMEVRAGRGPVYLDMTHFTPEHVRKLKVVVPHAMLRLERAGIVAGDKFVKKMEYTPFFTGVYAEGGGIIVNLDCETSLPGLYCCGDSMAQSRVGPAALPGAAVSGTRAAGSAVAYAREAPEPGIDQRQVEELRKFTFAPIERKDGIQPDHIIIGVNEVLLRPEVTIVARGDRLEKAIAELERIRDEEVPLLYAPTPHYLRIANETRTSVLIAEMYLRSRLMRTESRNLFLREDYPYTDNVDWLKWTMLRQENGKMKLWTEDIPIDKYKIKPRMEKYLCPIFEVAGRRGVKWE
ncbi:MAG: FAD-binding protein [Chloroflexi bacterium]|nr:FAD-binding protein [Chloroflexota bacterium]